MGQYSTESRPTGCIFSRRTWVLPLSREGRKAARVRRNLEAQNFWRWPCSKYKWESWWQTSCEISKEVRLCSLARFLVFLLRTSCQTGHTSRFIVLVLQSSCRSKTSINIGCRPSRGTTRFSPALFEPILPGRNNYEN